jgi:hypothetical protein
MYHKNDIFQRIGMARCGERICRRIPGTQISIASNSWFSNSNIKPEIILMFTYCFANGITKYDDIKRECNLYRPDLNGYTKKIGSDTIASKF